LFPSFFPFFPICKITEKKRETKKFIIIIQREKERKKEKEEDEPKQKRKDFLK
jgi:hypothetical protein